MDIKLTDKEKIKVLNGRDLCVIMQDILLREDKIDQNREHFWVIGLETNSRILFIELISLGSINETIAEPMEVFSLAVQKRAVKIILCHNHPSGDLFPSDTDKDVTDRLIQTGNILKIKVIDHLILSPKEFYSFSHSGLLKELRESTKYVPSYVLIERLKKQAIEIGIKMGKDERAIEIAKELKKNGADIKMIALSTGLSEAEINKLKE